MQQLVPIAELKSRAERIGISLPKIARAAGVAPSTAYRALNDQHDIGVKKLRALMRALELEERRVAEHLVAIGVDGERAA